MSHPGAAGSDADAWAQWLTAWETYLGDMTAWVAAGDQVVPEPPTTPRPDGPAPTALRVRLLRAAALRTALTGQLAAQLDTARPWRPPATPGKRLTLDL